MLFNVRPVPTPVIGEFGAVMPEPAEPIEPLEARLRQCVPADYSGTIDVLVGDGDAAEEILAAANTQQCDLIVMGTHGRSGFERLLMGSVAEAVLRGSSCPVMTVRLSKPADQSTDSSAEPAVKADDLVTVSSAANAVDAEIIRNALSANGIRCFSEGSNQGGFSGALGFPVKINVRAADFDRASKIIESREACCH